jgi:hypothetical protein
VRTGYTLDTVHHAVQILYHRNLEVNPLYRDFVPVLLRPHAQPGLPLLYPRSLAPLTDRGQRRRPQPGPEDVGATPAVHTVVSNTLHGNLATARKFDSGVLESWQGRHIPLITGTDGQPCSNVKVGTVCSPDNNTSVCIHGCACIGVEPNKHLTCHSHFSAACLQASLLCCCSEELLA